MCGIAAIAILEQPRALPDLRERLEAMAQAQRHRGPDDGGVHLAPGGRAGLANRRLAIRDLSPAGHMPMGNDAGTVWITYNGEIYNTEELRAELERDGFPFRSRGDTEVILRGYEAWGERVVERLRGIFALAILDRRGAARLFLARDRLGVKPLYYARADGVLLAASELKGLQAAGLVSREVDPAGLVAYLTLGAVPAPLTIFRDVRALGPGTTLTVRLDAASGIPRPVNYWSPPRDGEEPANEVAGVEQLRALLDDAVRSQLVSDVPLGAFLSGGLDSSAIVALARKATNASLRTCTMTFEETQFSEAAYARTVATMVGAEHYERVITAEDVVREMDRILWAMEQPTVDGVNTYFVSQTARDAGLTVALSGLGGDELFGGYTSTFGGVPQMLRALQVAHLIPGAPALTRGALGVLPGRRGWSRVQDALGRPSSPASAYLTRRGLFSSGEVRRLVAADIWAEAQERFDPVRHIEDRVDGPTSDLFAWTCRAELGTYTQSQLLRDTDAMSMAHSLEVRVPFLDHTLVEAVLRLPTHLKVSQPGPKPLLRAALGEILPSTVRERRDKQGFVFPFDRWMRGPLKGSVRGMLSAAKAWGWLRPEAVDEVWDGYQRGRLHWSRPWSLAVLGNEHLWRAAPPVLAPSQESFRA